MFKEKIEQEFYNRLKTNEKMQKYTSFKIGGPAEYFIEINDEQELVKILQICREEKINYYIIGNGTNILVKDNGIKGLVIKNNIKYINEEKIDSDESIFEVGSGVLLGEFCKNVAELGYGYIDKLYGIPGSIGGAIKMNAGAYGLEMKDIVYSTKYLDENLNICEINNEKQNFEYRHSIFSDNQYIILSTKIKLKKINKDEQLENMKNIMNQRITNQPLNYPSAGSTFKRGTDYITSKLLDELGLKGLTEGGAQLSEKHAGFVINKNNAKAEDVIKLIKKITSIVKEKANKDIELEIIIIGE